MSENKISVGLFGGFVELTEDEMRSLMTLRETEGWKTMLTLLKGMDDGMTVALRDRDADLEDLRYNQGVSAAASRIAEIVEDDAAQWYKDRAEALAEESEGTSEKS